MIYIILGCIIGVVVGYNYCYELDEGILGGFLGGLIGVIAYFIIGSIIGLFLPTKDIITTQNLCALNDTTTIEGQTFLFSGYIDEELKYRYLVETKKGIHVEEKGITNAYIKTIEKGEQPYIEEYDSVLKSDLYYWFAVNLKDNEYVFYLPEGSITNEYNVDLE